MTLWSFQIRNLFGGRLKQWSRRALMKPEIAMFFSDVGVPTYDGYGLSETTPVISNNGPKRAINTARSKAFKDTNVVIDKSRVGEDSPDGEIVVYGAQVMQGYHNKPEATKDAMMPDTWNGFPGIRPETAAGWTKTATCIYRRFKDEYKLETANMCIRNR